MYRQIDDFLQSYESLTEGTRKIFSALTDQNLNQTVTDGHRSLARIAWHIVSTVPEMMSRTGLKLAPVDDQAPPPASAAEIRSAYDSVTQELVKSLKASWTDATLLETDDMYGQAWPRGMTLQALQSHEIHHRGQMTVLLRQAGAPIPGIYGPSKEEWVQFGMDAPSI